MPERYNIVGMDRDEVLEAIFTSMRLRSNLNLYLTRTGIETLRCLDQPVTDLQVDLEDGAFMALGPGFMLIISEDDLYVVLPD